MKVKKAEDVPISMNCLMAMWAANKNTTRPYSSGPSHRARNIAVTKASPDLKIAEIRLTPNRAGIDLEINNALSTNWVLHRDKFPPFFQLHLLKYVNIGDRIFFELFALLRSSTKHQHQAIYC